MEDLLLLSPFRIVSNEDGTLSALLRTAVVLLLLLRCQLHVSKHPWLNAADDDAEQLRCQMEQFCIECQEEYRQSLTSRGFTWTFPYAQDQHIYRGTAGRALQVLEDFYAQSGNQTANAAGSEWKDTNHQLCPQEKKEHLINSTNEGRQDFVPVHEFERVPTMQDLIDTGVEALDITSDPEILAGTFDAERALPAYAPLKNCYWQEERDDVEGGEIREYGERIFLQLSPAGQQAFETKALEVGVGGVYAKKYIRRNLNLPKTEKELNQKVPLRNRTTISRY